MEKVLVTTNKYNGQYVALKSEKDNTIVGSGKNPGQALKSAKKKGVEKPYILYIPDKDMVQIY